eukprot:TRINITY_DN49097_c0_g1_i2.p2 TRINITY_DN49097_c0_g1~~TRINITY_DN49097_c0_g1_i2.p2  ORF type:complete len:164 (+),score=38.59 TRINITY_DN49097_c0_g1_i2:84-575(+)
MIRRPPRSTLSSSSAASDVYKRQGDKGREMGVDLAGVNTKAAPAGAGNTRPKPNPKKDPAPARAENRTREEKRGGVDDIVQAVPIPANAVGWVMGKGGSNINAMQKQSGCSLRLQENEWKDFGRVWKYISLRGSGKNVDRAKKLIYLSLEKFNPDRPEREAGQ